jgi:UDP-N-acetylmuramoyl-tripeptide--D-alanyl-D-alanine ligase
MSISAHGPALHAPPADSRGSALKERLGVAAARAHRRRLTGVSFIGVTGSVGKTTTKEMIAAALGSVMRGRKSPADANNLAVIAKTILRTTRRDRFCVVEVAAGKRVGQVARSAQLLRPEIAVVTAVGADHRSTYRTLDGTAAEKRAPLDNAAAGSTAVLNADDPRVLALGKRFSGRVITYGLSPGAMLRAENVSAAWPVALNFTLISDRTDLEVQTRLLGAHWITAALAALGASVAAGVSLQNAARALARAEPVPNRMYPQAIDGVYFIDDTAKAPYWTLGRTFEFLAQARCRRKILVMGTISDYSQSATQGVSPCRLTRSHLPGPMRVRAHDVQGHRSSGANLCALPAVGDEPARHTPRAPIPRLEPRPRPSAPSDTGAASSRSDCQSSE